VPRFETLALKPPIEPMQTRHVERIPEADGWTYEPKWDGFRCVAFREATDVELESKSGQSLTRYFPEIVAALLKATATRFVVDGELYVERDNAFDFDALLQRIHPAESRVRMLSKETPASYQLPLVGRRARLETFVEKNFHRSRTIVLSPATSDAAQAKAWFAGSYARIDGVIAKRNVPYSFGRDAVVKIKRRYTADCVVGGFRTTKERWKAQPCRLRRIDERGGAQPCCEGAQADRRTAGIHRLRARRTEPVAAYGRDGMVSRAPQNRGRSLLRSRHRTAVPPRRTTSAPAPG
jgi:ATP-dependent DNA ligase